MLNECPSCTARYAMGLDHCPHCGHATRDADDLDGLTKAKLLDLARDRGLDVTSRTTKAKLLDLLGG